MWFVVLLIGVFMAIWLAKQFRLFVVVVGVLCMFGRAPVRAEDCDCNAFQIYVPAEPYLTVGAFHCDTVNGFVYGNPTYAKIFVDGVEKWVVYSLTYFNELVADGRTPCFVCTYWDTQAEGIGGNFDAWVSTMAYDPAMPVTQLAERYDLSVTGVFDLFLDQNWALHQGALLTGLTNVAIEYGHVTGAAEDWCSGPLSVTPEFTAHPERRPCTTVERGFWNALGHPGCPAGAAGSGTNRVAYDQTAKDADYAWATNQVDWVANKMAGLTNFALNAAAPISSAASNSLMSDSGFVAQQGLGAMADGLLPTGLTADGTSMLLTAFGSYYKPSAGFNPYGLHLGSLIEWCHRLAVLGWAVVYYLALVGLFGEWRDQLTEGLGPDLKTNSMGMIPFLAVVWGIAKATAFYTVLWGLLFLLANATTFALIILDWAPVTSVVGEVASAVGGADWVTWADVVALEVGVSFLINYFAVRVTGRIVVETSRPVIAVMKAL